MLKECTYEFLRSISYTLVREDNCQRFTFEFEAPIVTRNLSSGVKAAAVLVLPISGSKDFTNS